MALVARRAAKKLGSISGRSARRRVAAARRPPGTLSTEQAGSVTGYRGAPRVNGERPLPVRACRIDEATAFSARTLGRLTL